MQPQAAGTEIHPGVAPAQYPPQNLYPNNYPSLHPNPNPDPYSAAAAAAAATCTSAQTFDAAYYSQPIPYAQKAIDATSAAGYYQDPNAHNWSISYASSVAGQLVAPKVNPIAWKNLAKNKFPKKRKNPVQHFWCDVCKLEVTSKEILDTHKQGKKHNKNLEKLKAALAPAPVVAPPVGVPSHPIIGPPEKPTKRKSKEPEDLESKKKKIVAGGTAVNAIKTCEICNVVCNSEVVFRFHLAGQKHVTMMKERSLK